MIKRPILLLLCVLVTACKPEPHEIAAGESVPATATIIIASNYPLYFFARQIAGETSAIDVRLPVMDGDPANWKPDSAAISELQKADLILLNGAGYESWLSWVSLPPDRLLDTSSSFRERLLPMLGETVHQHGPAGDHSHQGKAFTVWLDPELAIRQGQAIQQALSALAPGNSDIYAANLAQLTRDLQALDRALNTAFAALDGRAVIFSHPVYQYLQARYQLNGVSLHWEPEELPGTKDWIDLHEVLVRHPASLMLWEDEPLEETRARLQETAIHSIPFRTISNRPAGGDYFDMMEVNLDGLRSIKAGS